MDPHATGLCGDVLLDTGIIWSRTAWLANYFQSSPDNQDPHATGLCGDVLLDTGIIWRRPG